jgi:hypothetical protein
MTTTTLARFPHSGSEPMATGLADGTQVWLWHHVNADGSPRYNADVYLGKSCKNACKYYFRTPDQRAQWIAKLLDAHKDQAIRRAASAAKRKAVVTALVPGDIVSRSWGYDMTIVDYYEVLSVTPSGKTVNVCKIDSAHLEHESEGMGYGAGKCVPIKGSGCREAITCRVASADSVCVRGDHAYKWDGKPDHYNHND